MTTDLKRLSDADIVRVCAYVSACMSKKADRFVRLRGSVCVCGGGSWDNGLFLSWVNDDMLFTDWKNPVQNVNISDHLNNEDTHTDMKPDNQSTV